MHCGTFTELVNASLPFSSCEQPCAIANMATAMATYSAAGHDSEDDVVNINVVRSLGTLFSTYNLVFRYSIDINHNRIGH